MKTLLLLLSLSSFSAIAFDSVQIGPSLKIIDIAHPLQAGLEVRTLNGYLGLSAHKGFMPAVVLDEFSVKIDNLDFGLKIHPWKGSFYVGALIGNQDVTVKTKEEIQGINVDIEGRLKSSYITPHIGWQWRWNSGFFMGMQLGWQLNSGAKTSISSSEDNNPLIVGDSDFQDAKKEIEDEGNKLGNTALPSIGLLQMGWLF